MLAFVDVNEFGPAHKYVPPPVAVRFTLVTVQVKLFVPVIPAVGVVVLLVTDVVALAVQPLVVLVTVTV
jgi:hypothetical protein